MALAQLECKKGTDSGERQLRSDPDDELELSMETVMLRVSYTSIHCFLFDEQDRV